MKTSYVPNHVTELQGPYGPLQILESKVQQIWALQHVQNGNWLTQSGRHLKVCSPGRWNRGAGPDFLEATIELDGVRQMGDVEIHLYREDWWRHGHNYDPAYDEVILHVVLFAGGMDRKILTSAGVEPDEWNMGPWTREDIESVSGGSPGLFGELVPELKEWMESDDPVRIRERLKIGADRRWQDKESMARCLLDSHGWEGGLHRMCLYYLGFPFNRRPFYEMAEALPMSCWRSLQTLEIVRRKWSESVRWRYGRPANRAECRLKQYLELNSSIPDWAVRLRKPPEFLMDRLRNRLSDLWSTESTSAIRRQAGLPDWNIWLMNHVLGGKLNASLVQRLWVDVFLPVLVVGNKLSQEEGMGVWFHGRTATFPDSYKELFKLASIQNRKQYPLCNGWVQGILWLEDQLRLERVRSTIGK